jgi:DNA-binding IscR family transcriptional regulator
LGRKHQTPLFREYVTLALLGHITRRFIAGKAPLQGEQLARVQGVPLTLIDSLISDLIQANMLVRTVRPKGVLLARPPETIPVADVLKVVQHQLHNGPQGFTVGTDTISQLLMRRDEAVQGTLAGITLRHLVNDQHMDQVSDEEWEISSEVPPDQSEAKERISRIAHSPMGFPGESSPDVPSVEKRPAP